VPAPGFVHLVSQLYSVIDLPEGSLLLLLLLTTIRLSPGGNTDKQLTKYVHKSNNTHHSKCNIQNWEMGKIIVLYRVVCVIYVVVCVIYRVLCVLYRVVCVLFRIVCVMFRVVCVLFRIVCVMFRVVCVLFRIVCV
jgi:hypothetical protein